MKELPTKDLTRALEQALTIHQPPLVRGRRIKLRYAHQGGRNPPVVVIHGNQTQHVPDAYRRFLENHFRQTFRLQGHADAGRVPHRRKPVRRPSQRADPTPGQSKQAPDFANPGAARRSASADRPGDGARD